MKEVCRICARELCGNQRRWIFHPAAKLNLQVLLSHALGCDLQRGGGCEFVCSKCAFMLERMYRFDTVIARVEALSIERLHRLLQEKERLRQCVSVLYRKNNPHAGCAVDVADVHDAKYCALLQDDLIYSMYESWAGDEDQALECPHHSQFQASEVSTTCHRSRKCRVCGALRVADSDYEAVCKVPRKVARSISCGPSTQYSVSGTGSVCGEEQAATVASATPVPEKQRTTSRSSDGDQGLRDRESSSTSVESLDKTLDGLPAKLPQDYGEMDGSSKDNQSSDSVSEEHIGAVVPPANIAMALSLVQKCAYRPIQSPRGSKLPVLIKTGFVSGGTKLASPEQVLGSLFDGKNCLLIEPELPQIQLDSALELTQLEELWQDEYMPFCVSRVPKSLIEEQQSQLNQYECAAAQCVSELQKAQLQVQSLQNKIHESEASNKKLQEKLCDMETELQSIRQATQNRERTIQNLTESLSNKDSEAPDGSVDSSSLFLCRLQLESCQRDQRLTQRRVEDLTRSRDRLQADLREALQHRETSHQHNQDLHKTLEQLRSELQVKTCELRDHEMNTRAEITNRDKTISQLQQSLHHKDTLLQECSELMEHMSQSGGSQARDALLDVLRSRIRERDRALEDSIDEKFRCLQEKDDEVRRLQLALREKDRDLERLSSILNNNNDTVTSLDALVRRKDMDLERMQESCQKLKWLKQQSEEKHTHALRERDSIITQLQTALHTNSKETEELRSVLLRKVLPGPADVLHDLQSHLSMKERLFQEVMSERSRQVQDQHRNLTELLEVISSRDQEMQDYGERLQQVISERSDQVLEFRRQLLSREQELTEVKREREKEAVAPAGRELQTLKSVLKEKDSFIQELLRLQNQVTLSSADKAADGVCTSSQGDLEIQAVKEELQLTLKKHKQTELELVELRSALKAVQDGTLSPDLQCFLQQLVSEQQKLNESLRSEMTLYQNLRHIQSEADSTEKTNALHAELESLQALRRTLEDVLARTRVVALAVDRASLAQTDYGGGARPSVASGPAGGAGTNSI